MTTTATTKQATIVSTPVVKQASKRPSDPNFLSVDQFVVELAKQGFSFNHDYIVKCIKQGVIKNQPAPSLLPEAAKSGKATRYRIPVAEVARIAQVLKDQNS